jgi:hypothetical protein
MAAERPMVLAKPVKPWERAVIAIASFLLFGIIGSIAAFFWGSVPLLPLSAFLQTLLLWALPPAFLAMVLALVWPRVMLCIVYPFSWISLDAN